MNWRARGCGTTLLAVAWLTGSSLLAGQTPQGRLLTICVAASAPPEIRQSAERILQGVASSPLLSLLGAEGTRMEDSTALSSANTDARALHHLILVGLPSDPMIRMAWRQEAKVEDGGFYIFGFGHLRGTIGYIESGRNPFLHSGAISAAPYETEVITITGSSPAGIDLAVDAFLRNGLINGVVAAPGWTRPSTTLLDRDPSTPPIDALPQAPAREGANIRIGITEAGENEYRDELQDTGVLPVSIMRVKYSRPDLWRVSAGKESSSITDYQNGLDRRAIGETLWIADFASPREAAEVATRIARSAQLKKQGIGWFGTISDSHPPAKSDPPLALWVSGKKVLLSNVPGLRY